jgi:hypothetical protein
MTNAAGWLKRMWNETILKNMDIMLLTSITTHLLPNNKQSFWFILGELARPESIRFGDERRAGEDQPIQRNLVVLTSQNISPVLVLRGLTFLHHLIRRGDADNNTTNQTCLDFQHQQTDPNPTVCVKNQNRPFWHKLWDLGHLVRVDINYHVSYYCKHTLISSCSLWLN